MGRPRWHPPGGICSCWRQRRGFCVLGIGPGGGADGEREAGGGLDSGLFQGNSLKKALGQQSTERWGNAQLASDKSWGAFRNQCICDAVFTLDNNEVPSVPHLTCTIHQSCSSLKYFSNEDWSPGMCNKSWDNATRLKSILFTSAQPQPQPQPQLNQLVA